jgi:hypothetical protein
MLAASLEVRGAVLPPVSWRLLLGDVARFVTSKLEVTDDSALATVVEGQLAMLPSRERRFPDRRELAHDYAAWHTAVRDAQERYRRERWEEHVAPLRSFGPAPFIVADPKRLSDDPTQGTFITPTLQSGRWELDSAAARHVV